MAQITGSDLIAPNGLIQATLFPDTDRNALSTLMDAYVTRAYADDRVSTITDDTKQNKGAKLLASYFALTDVYLRMLGEPTQVNNGPEKGSTTYTKDQRDGIKALADQCLADLAPLIPVAASADTPRPTSARLHLSFF